MRHPSAGEGSLLAPTMSFTDQPLKKLRVVNINRNRPNVKSVRESKLPTNAEVAEQIAIKYRKGSFVRRKMIRDLCDYCLQVMWVYRNQLRLRLKGKTFSCPECYSTKEAPKTDHAIPGKMNYF